MCEFRRRHYSPSLQKGSKNKYKQHKISFFSSLRRFIPVSKRIDFAILVLRPYGERSKLQSEETANCSRKYLKCLIGVGMKVINAVSTVIINMYSDWVAFWRCESVATLSAHRNAAESLMGRSFKYFASHHRRAQLNAKRRKNQFSKPRIFRIHNARHRNSWNDYFSSVKRKHKICVNIYRSGKAKKKMKLRNLQWAHWQRVKW